MLKRVAIALALLASTTISEVQWVVMQSVTWAIMIQEADPSVGLVDTVISTLSGEAPCEHCDAIMEERQSQRDELLSLLASGPILAPIPSRKAIATREDVVLFTLSRPGEPFATFSFAPPRPPPRA